MKRIDVACLSLFAMLAPACAGATDLDSSTTADEPNDATASSSSQALEPQNGNADPPMLGKHLPRGASSGSSADMTWHSGAIMTGAVVETIFWGTRWADGTFAADKIAGLDGFYSGLSGSHYATTNTEYTGSNGSVGTQVTFVQHHVDLSAAPRHAPKTSAILSEVCKSIASPVANGYYPVYTDTRRGGAQYCAWHSYGTCSGVPVQFAFFFSLDGDAGCDPNDGSGLHSQGLSALANVSGHEYSEAVTDPRDGGWYDSGGNENADKCAWTFGAPLLTLSNGTKWKIQGNWSNAAFDAGTGYPNRSGQNGCLSGL